MTVKELIEKLQTCNPDARVVSVYDGPETYKFVDIDFLDVETFSDTVILEEDTEITAWREANKEQEEGRFKR